MGIRMRLHTGEPIGLALRRFKKLLQQHRVRWRQEPPRHVPQSEIRRTKEYAKLMKARKATLAAKRAGEQ